MAKKKADIEVAPVLEKAEKPVVESKDSFVERKLRIINDMPNKAKGRRLAERILKRR